MKSILTISIMTVIYLISSACATKYGPKGLGGGYWEEKIQEDVFMVGFRGNGYTSKNFTHRAFLRRCAEVALSNDKRFFRMQSQESSNNTRVVSTHNYATGQTNIQTTKKPTTEGTIWLSEDNCSVCFDAAQVLDNTNDLVEK